MLGAGLCMRRKLAEGTQIGMAVLLLGVVVICFAAALGRRTGSTAVFTPAFQPKNSALGGTLTILTLAPWAFVGFESISHSAAEARYPLRRSFRILAAAVVAAAAAYILLTLLAVTALPDGCTDWTEYVSGLDRYSGLASQPTFHAAFSAMGSTGTVLLSAAALCGIFTGLIGNYVALSRLLCALSDDGMLPGWVGVRDSGNTPHRAIAVIMGASVLLPFLGRAAISWIVDVTTVGATVAYALTSASAFKTARRQKQKGFMAAGLTGIAVSLFFALAFLVPNILSIKALSTESYLILTLWSLGGFLYFRFFLRRDRERRMGRSIVAWIVLLSLIIFTSSVWMWQTTENAMDSSVGAARERGEMFAAEDTDRSADAV